MAPPRISFRALPHLNALKGFEAAARLGSFRRAADELCITHAAISHQIKQLEADLDCALFSREGRTVTLTGEGRIFYEYVRQGLEHLLTGADVIRRTVSDAELRIETYVTVAIRWLSRLLPKFRAEHPDIPFSVNTRRTEWWFDEVNTDIAILYVERELPKNLMEKRLFDGVLYPVCSPKLLEKVNPVLGPADLLTLPLIEVSSAPRDWTCWLAAAGVADAEVPRFQKVDTYALAVEMAIDGDGIAMLNGPFAETELNQRTLIRPVPLIAPAPGRWSVIFRADHARDRKVKTFVDWLLAEVGSMSV